MTELNAECQLMALLIEERLTKAALSCRAMADVSLTDGDKRFYQGKAEGLQMGKEIVGIIKATLK